MHDTVLMCFGTNNIPLFQNCTHPLVWKMQIASLIVGEQLVCIIIYKKKKKLVDWMIKQLLNLVIAKYHHDFSVLCRSIICIIKPSALTNINLPIVCSLTLLSSKKSSDWQNPFPWPRTGILWSEIAKQVLYNKEYNQCTFKKLQEEC